MPVNTNDLRDMASEFRETTFTKMVIEAANQLDSTRTERNILRAELDAAREELAEERAKISAWTDDDQRDLNAAVADAMWHWDEMPMDCDDAISLTGILKSSLQDSGFQIVHLATRAQGESS